MTGLGRAAAVLAGNQGGVARKRTRHDTVMQGGVCGFDDG